MLQLNPDGKFLMNFCYINLFIVDKKVKLLLKSHIEEKIQFFFVKRKTKKLVRRAVFLISSERCFEFDQILFKLKVDFNDIWDLVFYYSVIREAAIIVSFNMNLSEDEEVNMILVLYLKFIIEFQELTHEIIDLRLKLIKNKTEMDLIQASAVIKNRDKAF